MLMEDIVYGACLPLKIISRKNSYENLKIINKTLKYTFTILSRKINAFI